MTAVLCGIVPGRQQTQFGLKTHCRLEPFLRVTTRRGNGSAVIHHSTRAHPHIRRRHGLICINITSIAQLRRCRLTLAIGSSPMSIWILQTHPAKSCSSGTKERVGNTALTGEPTSLDGEWMVSQVVTGWARYLRPVDGCAWKSLRVLLDWRVRSSMAWRSHCSAARQLGIAPVKSIPLLHHRRHLRRPTRQT